MGRGESTCSTRRLPRQSNRSLSPTEMAYSIRLMMLNIGM
jgi:hypothetical protein